MKNTEQNNSKLMKYILALNNLGEDSPYLEQIEAEYPRLVSAMRGGVKISENVRLVNAILGKLAEDEHCPCTIIKNDDTKCMCKEFRDMQEGTCHCGLYIKK